jgi:hypothetical protein
MTQIAASWPIRSAVGAIQILDRLAATGILLCAVFRRPGAS